MPLLLDDGTHRYIYGPSSTPIAQVDSTSNAFEYLHTDLLGTPRLITDSIGNVDSTSTFDAFGTRISHTGPTDSAIGFTGNLTDADTGLLYLRARDYDPKTGQFLTVDTALDSTHQPYAYTGNNPLQRTDPLGLDWLSDVGETVTAVGAGALDGITGGASSMIFNALVPGYDCFIQKNNTAFQVGSVAAQVIEAAIMVATVVVSLGAAAPAAMAWAGAKMAIRAGIKAAATSMKALVKSSLRSTLKTATSAIQRVVKQTDATSCAFNSFTADTPVLMADGAQKPIADVVVGDEVIATDPETGVTTVRPVSSPIRHGGEHEMVAVELSDGSVVQATDGHPFWEVRGEKFVDASDLAIGDVVRSLEGRELEVTGVATYVDDLLAYNLSIVGIHTYYAGETPVLVHNSCPIRGKWEITPAGTSATKMGPYGRLDKSASDELWWSKDNTGHGGSAWKVYKEAKNGDLHWYQDADEYGDFIPDKHKGPFGIFISRNDLH